MNHIPWCGATVLFSTILLWPGTQVFPRDYFPATDSAAVNALRTHILTVCGHKAQGLGQEPGRRPSVAEVRLLEVVRSWSGLSRQLCGADSV